MPRAVEKAVGRIRQKLIASGEQEIPLRANSASGSWTNSRSSIRWRTCALPRCTAVSRPECLQRDRAQSAERSRVPTSSASNCGCCRRRRVGGRRCTASPAARKPAGKHDFTDTDAPYGAGAGAGAPQASYTTDPNPRVGCVITKAGRWLARLTSARAPHAEINALRAAGDGARGATVYLTLEPCCHHGKTPPQHGRTCQCAGVARVVAAMQDPNPRVAGQGFAELKQAGIECASGLMQAEAEDLNPGVLPTAWSAGALTCG